MTEEEKELMASIESKMPSSGMQFELRDSKKGMWGANRDILGFYRPLQEAVIDLVAARYPDKRDDVEKLYMQANGFINEATGGTRKLKIHEFVSMLDLVMKDIDKEVVDDYTRLMCAAFMFRYVLGKREQPEYRVAPEELGHAFEAVYIMSVLPEELAAKVKRHLVAYGHVDDIVFNNRPPCVIDEKEGLDGKQE